MLVIVENVLWRSVVQDRHGAPPPADIGQILQQGGLAGLAAKAAQSLLNGAFGRGRNVLSSELREISGQALGFGVFDAQGLGSLVPWKEPST